MTFHRIHFHLLKPLHNRNIGEQDQQSTVVWGAECDGSTDHKSSNHIFDNDASHTNKQLLYNNSFS